MNTQNHAGRPLPRAAALELIADLLLETAGRDDEYPAYTEEQLTRRRDRRCLFHHVGWMQRTFAAELLVSELDDLAAAAGLSPGERAAWELHLRGHHVKEVARELGTTRPRAERFIHTARNRVAACGSASRGLYGAYLSLVRRGSSRG